MASAMQDLRSFRRLAAFFERFFATILGLVLAPRIRVAHAGGFATGM
jgi:hypothetical protein